MVLALTALSLIATLTACNDKQPPDVLEKITYVGPSIPPLPENLRSRTPDPGIRKDRSAYVELGRNRNAYKACDAEQVSFITYYDGLRNSTPKKK